MLLLRQRKPTGRALHQHRHHQQRESSHYPTLLTACQATPAIPVPFWSLLSKTDVDRLERVQRRATKMAQGHEDGPRTGKPAT